VSLAFDWILEKDAIPIVAMTPMIAITTSSSTIVKAFKVLLMVIL